MVIYRLIFMENKKNSSSLRCVAYRHENVGGCTIPGPHHGQWSQDSFWPSSSTLYSPVAGLSGLDIVRHGRLYLVADGVSLCADGWEASSLAAETAYNYYYHTSQAYPYTEQGRQQRLEDALWQAHLALLNWDEKFFCWRGDKHPDGVSHYYQKDQLTSFDPPTCPLCGGFLVGLQSTLLAVLVRGQRVVVAGLGDSSAFRISARAEFGEESIYTPFRDQFLGMPSLSRDAIVGQTFVLQPKDRILLCTDGVERVLNALYANAQWSDYLRDRLDHLDLGTVVPNLLLDLNGWRSTRPQEGKLQDDMALVVIGILEEESQQELVDSALRNYDFLQAEQKIANPLPTSMFKDFLDSAEAALIHQDHAQLWQLYGSTLHAYALAKLNESIVFDDRGVREIIRASASINPITRDWVTGYVHLSRLWAWANNKANPAEVSADMHHQITRDLYRLDLQHKTPDLAPRIINLIENVANQLIQLNRIEDARQYKTLSSYLQSLPVSAAPAYQLPSREAVIVPGLENIEELERRITQAVTNHDWVVAQEWIMELNKLRGNQLNLDTQAVDISAISSRRLGRSERPKGDTETNGRDSSSQLPYKQTDRLLENFSDNPVELMHEVARVVLNPDWRERNLGRGYELARESAKLLPDGSILRKDWYALWSNPDTPFDLYINQTDPTAYWSLVEIVSSVQTARDLSVLVSQSQKYHWDNLHPQLAKQDLQLMEKWLKSLKSLILPHEVGLQLWWYFQALCQARIVLSDVGDEDDVTTPASEKYNEAIWQAVLSADGNGQLQATYRMNAWNLLDQLVASQESVWANAAVVLQEVLRYEDIVLAAFHLYRLDIPDQLPIGTRDSLIFLKQHYVNAAWEHIFPMAERRKPIDRILLQKTQSQLLSSNIEVARLRGSDGLRLNTIYNLLSLLIHDIDGEIVNGFYAYEITVPRQLSEHDFRRLNLLRHDYIERAWESMLDIAREQRAFMLPPSVRSIGRIKPDTTTLEGRRLHAIREILPLLTNRSNDWVEYALFLYQWHPPYPLSAEDMIQLSELHTDCLDRAWHYLIDAINGEERPTLTVEQVQKLQQQLRDVDSAEQGPFATHFYAFDKLLQQLLVMKTPSVGRAKRALLAQKIEQTLLPVLLDEEANELRIACRRSLTDLWAWCIKITRNPFLTQAQIIRNEIDQLPATIPQEGDYPIWEAVRYMLKMALERHNDPYQPKWEGTVQELFKAFHIITLAQDLPDHIQKQEQLDRISYQYLVDWKDSLPELPSFWQRSRINAEKQRIQEYWQLRQEYNQDGSQQYVAL